MIGEATCGDRNSPPGLGDPGPRVPRKFIG